MPISAVVLDIGGVLECNPRTGWQERWAERLSLHPEDFSGRLGPIWRHGSVGALTLAEVHQETARALGIDARRVGELMEDMWAEYVGTLNGELASYFASLRPRYRTAIVSNSFVGAREREQAAYRFEDLCDTIVYSHEVGWMKPDPRIYRAAGDRLDVPPCAAVFLDDVQENVDGAIAVGMHAIRFTGTGEAIAELRRLLEP